MSNNLLTPQEIAVKTIDAAEKKANLSVKQMMLLGIFAGMFIGFGGHGFLVVIQSLGKIDVGLAKFLGACVFPVGLMLVLIAGAELFTGNNAMTIGCLNNRITYIQMLKNWTIVYIANFIGSIVLAYILSKTSLYTGALADKVVAVACAKVKLTTIECITRGILCNIIVVLAVWMATAAKDVIGKLFAAWFPIMLFVLSGFEHCVANMFFIPMGIFTGANITWSQMWLNNLIPVTIGNIIGGGIIVPVVYHYCYLNKKSIIEKSNI